MTDPLLVRTAAEVFTRHTEPGSPWTALAGGGTTEVLRSILAGRMRS